MRKEDSIPLQEEAFIKKVKDIIGEKKCIFYGFGTNGRNTLLTFEDYEINVEYVVDMNYEKMREEDISHIFRGNYEIKDPYELAYEVGQAVVLVMADPFRYRNSIKELLEGLGYIHGKDYFWQIDFVTYPLNCLDPMLGYSRKYEDGTYGFKVFGQKNMAEQRIVTVGGSTTAFGTYLAKSWPQFLYEKISTRNVCVYNGGISGYDSSQELLKLIRDCLPIKPSLVISYSGYNDLVQTLPNHRRNRYPYVSLYMQDVMKTIAGIDGKELTLAMGEESKESVAQIWINNQKMMRAICKMFGIAYVGILQPCLACVGEGYVLSETEKKRIGVEVPGNIEACRSFYDEIKKADVFSEWLLDGKDIFDGATDVFYDICHIKEKGNELIAEYVQNIIEENIVGY